MLRSLWSKVILVGLGLLCSAWICFAYGPPNFWFNFRGCSEERVVYWLGQPIYDDRLTIEETENDNRWVRRKDYKRDEPFHFGYYHGMGCQLSLEFENGVVVKQTRSSK